MKKYLKIIYLTILIYSFPLNCIAQDSNQYPLTLGKIESYLLDVTYDKTSHLIFPSAIRYVDLGSEYLIAGKADEADNVLRIKATVRDFEDETNFSVITNDGRFYSFNAYYSSYPDILSYDLLTMQKQLEKENLNDVLFEELGETPPYLTDLLLEAIHNDNKRIVKHLGSKSFGISFTLKGIYIHNGKYYFHTEVKNSSNVPFEIDYVNFKIIDKKVAKRTVVQQQSIIPLRTYKPLIEIKGNSTEQNVYLLDRFTTSSDKMLLIEIFEKNGARNQTIQIQNSDLIKARVVSDMHLKI
ncbi:Bacteroides conjugative transposon TraN protein [Paenimyroides ummariense]|uniref:Bacteroides conjugative transposon TraN protein n=1 Tax=Paenimyroides ummariense TaxID=913024 RepID=A0A1I5GKT5_9FLAO|nr:conjugative transposon protein TraN [Paenimyroides ummariense]SFO36598.1 Bacteroides conjugative transposon TraN protein [Paenimyroides ummariense]